MKHFFFSIVNEELLVKVPFVSPAKVGERPEEIWVKGDGLKSALCPVFFYSIFNMFQLFSVFSMVFLWFSMFFPWFFYVLVE